MCWATDNLSEGTYLRVAFLEHFIPRTIVRIRAGEARNVLILGWSCGVYTVYYNPYGFTICVVYAHFFCAQYGIHQVQSILQTGMEN